MKYISNKEQDKSPEGDPNEMEMYYLSDREFKITIIKMLTKVRRTMHVQSETLTEYKKVEYNN